MYRVHTSWKKIKDKNDGDNQNYILLECSREEISLLPPPPAFFWTGFPFSLFCIMLTHSSSEDLFSHQSIYQIWSPIAFGHLQESSIQLRQQRLDTGYLSYDTSATQYLGMSAGNGLIEKSYMGKAWKLEVQVDLVTNSWDRKNWKENSSARCQFV